MHRLIVLGTGTDIGKTWVAAGIARAARERGGAVLALKPIETGVTASSDAGSDAAILAAASARDVGSCYQFPEPVTPWLAAEQCGASIDLGRVKNWVSTAETSIDTTTHVASCSVIETAGGVFSPLSQTESNFELARALDPAQWILVAPNRLGVLHDVIATVEAMRARGRIPDALVLNQLGAKGPSSSTNADTLRRLPISCPVLEMATNDPAAGFELLDHLSQSRGS